MTTNPFYRLAPFIQEYIYRKEWAELRSVQVKAIGEILDSNGHVLITSGTASGKTEAAMLPVLTLLDADPPKSIAVLYIGPLKALINDQFERLQGLLDETGISVQSWHGDVAQSKKTKFLQRAQGILQITPESMEAMLIHRHSDLRRLFGDLRFVIIDEVHAFIDSDRGRQVICQLQRLERYQQKAPRRIGLSATIGDPEAAGAWLAGISKRPVVVIRDDMERRNVELGLEHFWTEDEDDERNSKPGRQQANPGADEIPETLPDEMAIYRHVYGMCQRVNTTLIYANQRSEVETTVANLRKLSEINKTPDIYHVHHGSISAELREAAENVMREPDRRTVVAATVTMELGVDIGHLDQVLQINATHSVSSFVQRLGRSGRRESPARMFFYCSEELPGDQATVAQRIPWDLLQTIAIIQLYAEERWVEPPRIPHYPFSLLYHQTMSIMAASTEMTAAQLAGQVLTLAPFQHTTEDHYRALLRHLLDTGHLEQTETGSLIVGLEGEKVVNSYRFYATFSDERAVRVLANGEEIGAIDTFPEVADHIRLAGHTWRVVAVDEDQSVVHVVRARGRADAFWAGTGGKLHRRIMQRARKVLQEEAEYAYLHKRAGERLEQARRLAAHTEIADSSVVQTGPQRYLCLPWDGTQAVETLLLILESRGYKIGAAKTPYHFEVVNGPSSKGTFVSSLQHLAATAPTVPDLARDLADQMLVRSKYDQYVPVTLLRQSFGADVLNVEEAAECLAVLGRT